MGYKILYLDDNEIIRLLSPINEMDPNKIEKVKQSIETLKEYINGAFDVSNSTLGEGTGVLIDNLDNLVINYINALEERKNFFAKKDNKENEKYEDLIKEASFANGVFYDWGCRLSPRDIFITAFFKLEHDKIDKSSYLRGMVEILGESAIDKLIENGLDIDAIKYFFLTRGCTYNQFYNMDVVGEFNEDIIYNKLSGFPGVHPDYLRLVYRFKYDSLKVEHAYLELMIELISLIEARRHIDYLRLYKRWQVDKDCNFDITKLDPYGRIFSILLKEKELRNPEQVKYVKKIKGDTDFKPLFLHYSPVYAPYKSSPGPLYYDYLEGKISNVQTTAPYLPGRIATAVFVKKDNSFYLPETTLMSDDELNTMCGKRSEEMPKTLSKIKINLNK